MPTKTWKAIERRIATVFGCKRQRLSGSSGRDDETASDTTHKTLFLEIKYRESHAVRTLYEKTAKLALREGKVPVVILVDKGKPGFLVCVYSEGVRHVASEMIEAQIKAGQHCEGDE